MRFLAFPFPAVSAFISGFPGRFELVTFVLEFSQAVSFFFPLCPEREFYFQYLFSTV